MSSSRLEHIYEQLEEVPAARRELRQVSAPTFGRAASVPAELRRLVDILSEHALSGRDELAGSDPSAELGF